MKVFIDIDALRGHYRTINKSAPKLKIDNSGSFVIIFNEQTKEWDHYRFVKNAWKLAGTMQNCELTATDIPDFSN